MEKLFSDFGSTLKSMLKLHAVPVMDIDTFSGDHWIMRISRLRSEIMLKAMWMEKEESLGDCSSEPQWRQRI